MRYLFLLALVFTSFIRATEPKYDMASGIVRDVGGTKQTACVVGDPRPACCQADTTQYPCGSRPTNTCCSANLGCYWGIAHGTTPTPSTPDACFGDDGCRPNLTCNQRHTSDCCSLHTSKNCTWSNDTCYAPCNGGVSLGANTMVISSGKYTHGTNKTPSCLSNYTGTPLYRCSNGSWNHVSGSCVADIGCNESNNHNNSNCNLPGSPDNSSAGTCRDGYTNNCSYYCNNGTWSEQSNTCRISQCSAPSKQTGCLAFSAINSGTSQSRSCETPNYTGSGCSYTCTNGNPTSITNNCTQATNRPCPALTYDFKAPDWTAPETGITIRGGYYRCSLTQQPHDTIVFCTHWNLFSLTKNSKLSWCKNGTWDIPDISSSREDEFSTQYFNRMLNNAPGPIATVTPRCQPAYVGHPYCI